MLGPLKRAGLPYYLSTKTHQSDESLLTNPLTPSILMTPGEYSQIPLCHGTLLPATGQENIFPKAHALCVPSSGDDTSPSSKEKLGCRPCGLQELAQGWGLLTKRQEPLVCIATMFHEAPVIPR